MSRKRIAIAAAVVILGGGIAVASGFANVVATVLYAGVYQSLFPSSVSWDSHGAFVKCDGAIASSAWPTAPAAACQAMHMCANEARLSDSQSKMLADHIKKTPGCPAL